MSENASGGLRFECTECGECCTNRGDYAYVYVDDEEVDDLAEALGVTVRWFKQRYTFVDEDGWRQLKLTKDACVFLDRDTGRCQVYTGRPVQCRTFPFWKDMIKDGEWTPEARKLCEGVGRGKLYTIEDVEARLAESADMDD